MLVAALTFTGVLHDVRNRWRRIVEGPPVALMPRCPKRVGWRRWRRLGGRLGIGYEADRHGRIGESRGLGGPTHADWLTGVIAPGHRIQHRRDRARDR